MTCTSLEFWRSFREPGLSAAEPLLYNIHHTEQQLQIMNCSCNGDITPVESGFTFQYLCLANWRSVIHSRLSSFQYYSAEVYTDNLCITFFFRVDYTFIIIVREVFHYTVKSITINLAKGYLTTIHSSTHYQQFFAAK